MKHHRSETTRDPITSMAVNLAEIMAERSRMNKDLLIALANAVAANEKAQQQFRIAVLTSLSKIEVMVSMIQGAQIVQANYRQPIYEDEVNKHAKAAQDYVTRRSQELGLKMVKFVYDDSEPQSEQPKRGRKSRQSPSYEI